MNGRWLKTVPVVVGVVTALVGVGSWIETRYAKAADVEQLKQAIESVAVDLRIGQLENRRTVLRSELFQLKSTRSPTALELRRSAEVEAELHDVEEQLRVLRTSSRWPGPPAPR